MLKRTKALKSRKPFKKGKGIKQSGKKTEQWREVRNDIRTKMLGMGIVRCELQWEGCLNNFTLGLAHSLRRRFITTNEELEEVILACVNCHEKLDYDHSKEETYEIVKKVIEGRNASR